MPSYVLIKNKKGLEKIIFLISTIGIVRKEKTNSSLAEKKSTHEEKLESKAYCWTA